MQGGWLEQKGGKEVKASFMLTDDDKRLTDGEDDRGENDKPYICATYMPYFGMYPLDWWADGGDILKARRHIAYYGDDKKHV